MNESTDGRGARRLRQSFWFPLLVFAALAIASVPFSTGGGPVGAPTGWGVLGGTAAHGPHAALFWVIAMPLGYAATAWFYLRRERWLGPAGPWRGLVVSGLGLFAVLAVTLSGVFPPLQGAVLRIVPGDLVVRGLLPFLAVAVSLATLAVVQRSKEFGAFAAAFLVIAVTANLYDLANLAARIGLAVHGTAVNNGAMSIVLLAGAVYFDARSRRQRQAAAARTP